MGIRRQNGVRAHRFGREMPDIPSTETPHDLDCERPGGPPRPPRPREIRSPVVKKGRHRRFEEARKLKQAGPSAFDLGLGGSDRGPRSQDDEYAALAEKYGVVFDDDDDEVDEDPDSAESDDVD